MIDTDFRLSRIYAEGWRAARKLDAGECDRLDSRQLAQLSPYSEEPARSRWIKGLTDAIRE
jgi:ribosome modulation factor